MNFMYVFLTFTGIAELIVPNNIRKLYNNKGKQNGIKLENIKITNIHRLIHQNNRQWRDNLQVPVPSHCDK